MYKLMGHIHNAIDGTLRLGMLMPESLEFGSRGQICVCRCFECGREIRNLEDDFGSPPQELDSFPPSAFGLWG